MVSVTFCGGGLLWDTLDEVCGVVLVIHVSVLSNDVSILGVLVSSY